MQKFRSVKSQTLGYTYTSPNPERNQTRTLQSPERVNDTIVKDKLALSEDKNILTQLIRIKGQQKLLYLKQCYQRKLSPAEIFDQYPFCNFQGFVFDDQLLRDPEGNLQANIIEDNNGVHLIEEVTQNKSKYKKIHESERGFNGLGVSLMKDGSIFQGNYHDGNFCGLGYQLSAEGNTFIGNFKEGVKSGEGRYYWFTSEQMYHGEWLGGLPHGLGVYSSQDNYKGTFSNGLKYGLGEEHFANGDRYIGEYINGVAEGYGEYYWKDGSIYKGDFKHGLRHGYGIWQDKRQIYRGNYRMDKKEGFGIYKWVGKQIYKGEFRDDYRQGFGEYYRLTGKEEQQKLIYKGAWNRGQKCDDKVEEEKIVQLYLFLAESQKLEKLMEDRGKQPKQRVGHRNCIPHTIHHDKHHR